MVSITILEKNLLDLIGSQKGIQDSLTLEGLTSSCGNHAFDTV